MLQLVLISLARLKAKTIKDITPYKLETVVIKMYIDYMMFLNDLDISRRRHETGEKLNLTKKFPSSVEKKLFKNVPLKYRSN